ncbi:methyl-accepting chemotaxis protein [Austwickia chelonae]|uniref:Putative methyl-accepting chemotaxis protein n=1 Tax=Austwickia chelonae NBRC 105200 TaxID=1184607 RepID=K6UM03_9MICO|nr:methyl-accepting chemotaxis protein [Austwickia chelonae]GAB77691.1 putative methyl-accepting chemotaxis protein [Austwickia chelonae NBRC 105200]SEW15866.1 methyl-accepting chemotaxis protein [Austwickia chelonae]
MPAVPAFDPPPSISRVGGLGRGLKLRGQILAVLAVMALASLAITLASIVSFGRMADASAKQASIEEIKSPLTVVQHRQVYNRMMFDWVALEQTQKGKDDTLAVVKKTDGQIADAVAQIRAKGGDKIMPSFEQFVTTYGEWQKNRDSVLVPLAYGKNWDLYMTTSFSSEPNGNVGIIRRYEPQLYSAEKELAEYSKRLSAEADSTRTGAVTLVVAVLLGALGVTTALAVLVLRRIGTNVETVRTGLAALAEGDLSRPTVVDSADEIGQMAKDLERARLNLHAVVEDAAQTAGYVAQASAQLASSAQNARQEAGTVTTQVGLTSTKASEVNTNIQTVAAGTEEMTASIREIAKNAQDAAGVAASAVTVADRTNATVAKLGDSSAKIGEVVKAITSIAEQTNLLALNATIEAARAGEAGKGFAVVANEVKDLAQETAKATEDIGHRVEQIQVDTEAAVAAISEISVIISQINDTQATIASAVEEQTATTNEMGRNVAEAATGAGDIAQGVDIAASAANSAGQSMEEIGTGIGDLAERAVQLREKVSTFRL